MPKTEEKKKMTLADYARAQKLAECRVCALPAEVREEIVSASDRGIKRKLVLDWLREVHGVSITDREMSVHRNGRHDEVA